MQNMKHHGSGAYSLVEMMIALSISLLLLLGVTSLFVSQIQSYHDQREFRGLQQNLRFAQDALSRDLRMAGYGIPVNDTVLGDWIPFVSGFTENPLVVDGGASGDEIVMAAAFDPPVAWLSMVAPTGTTVLSLSPGGGANLATSLSTVVYIGRAEVARIVGISGDTLTISTDPNQTGKGLRYMHAVSSIVEQVSVVRYQWVSETNQFPWQTYVVRETIGSSSTQRWQNMVAGYIDDFQASNNAYSVGVSWQGRTAEALATRGVSAQTADGFARMTVSTEVIPRNSPLLRVREMAGP